MIDAHVHIGKSEKCSRYILLSNLMVESLIFPNISSEVSPDIANESILFPVDALRYDPTSTHYKLVLIDPNYPKTLTQLSHYQVKGAKFHPSVTRMTLTDIRLVPFLKELSGRILLVHCGRDAISDYKYIHEVAKHYPFVTFIAAHLGGLAVDRVENTGRFIKENGILPNVYFDTSGVPNPWVIDKMIRTVGANHILFGSDLPYHDFEIAKYAIEQLPISQEDKNNIYDGNLRGILYR